MEEPPTPVTFIETEHYGGKHRHRRLRVLPNPPLARGMQETYTVKQGTNKPAAGAGSVQNRTCSTGSGGRHMIGWGPKQETTKGYTS